MSNINNAVTLLNTLCTSVTGDRGSTVVKEDRWFDSRWCHWNFSL